MRFWRPVSLKDAGIGAQTLIGESASGQADARAVGEAMAECEGCWRQRQ